MTKPELLAPVGSMESLKYAISAGADAVYLGGKNFSARAFSKNFSKEEMKEAVKYAHIRGVKIYVTVNTLIYETEVDKFIDYIRFLHKINIDAVIMQDIGMIHLIRKKFPNLEIHASTQMNIHNLECVKVIEKLGVKRVVLPRELSIEEIKYIKENTKLEIEIFIGGALCMSYSGECLMSSLLNGRSGNRGTCSQCCRMKYDLYSNNKKVNKNEYLLSMKDLKTDKYLYELIKIGVDSLKIEGRMKSSEYVYETVSLYRKTIDKKDIEEIKKHEENLKVIFNRDYTKGFIFSEDNKKIINDFRPNHMGIKIGKVIDYKKGYAFILLNHELNRLDGIRILGNTDEGKIVDKMYVNGKEKEKAFINDIVKIKIDGIKVNSTVLKTYDSKLTEQIKKKASIDKKIPINIKIELRENKPIYLKADDNKNKIEIKKYNVEKSINKSTTKEQIIQKLSKLGNTIYIIDKIDIKMDENIFVPISYINDIRRQMTILLDKKRLYEKEFIEKDYKLDPKEFIEEKGFIYKNKPKNSKTIYSKNEGTYIMPRIVKKYPKKEKVLASDLGSILVYDDVVTDAYLNVTNSYSVALLHSLGVKRITLSYELNDYEIEKLIKNYIKRYNKKPNLELIVKSYPEVMICKFNLLDYFNIKNDNNYLKDKKGRCFNIKIEDDIMKIYNYKKIENKDYDKYFEMGINTLRIEE